MVLWNCLLICSQTFTLVNIPDYWLPVWQHWNLKLGLFEKLNNLTMGRCWKCYLSVLCASPPRRKSKLGIYWLLSLLEADFWNWKNLPDVSHSVDCQQEPQNSIFNESSSCNTWQVRSVLQLSWLVKVVYRDKANHAYGHTETVTEAETEPASWDTLCPFCLLQNVQCCVCKSLGKVIYECSTSGLNDNCFSPRKHYSFILCLTCSCEKLHLALRSGA